MSATCCVVSRNQKEARRKWSPLQTEKNTRRGPRWVGAGGSLGPAVMLVLLPKCPACVAAYLAIWTGAGLAAPIAAYLRPFLAVVFAASVIYLVVAGVAERRRRLSAS